MDKLQALPQLRDVATDQQNNGSQVTLVIDRVTASRLGITAAQIDGTLYDAFGQRQILTTFTQLNQYHVILEALPEFQKNPAKLNDIYVTSTPAACGSIKPLSPIFESGNRPAGNQSSGTIPLRHDFL